MLAQARGQPQNSDSFRKSGYDRKVSGRAKSATDVGWIVWKAGRGEKIKTFGLCVCRSSHPLLSAVWAVARKCPLWTPRAGLLEIPGVLPWGGSSHSLPESKNP